MKKILFYCLLITFLFSTCKKENKRLSFSERNEEIRKTAKKVIKGHDTMDFYDPALLIGAQIPIFNIASRDSTMYNNNSIYGKKTILHFWYKSCSNCVTEIPGLIKFYDEFKGQNIELLSFVRESNDELIGDARNFPFNFPLLVNCGPLMDFTFEHMYGYPFYLYVDEKGIIKNYIRGEAKEMTSPDSIYNELKNMVLAN